MKILGYEINLRGGNQRDKDELAAAKKGPKGKVAPYSEISSKTFGTYKTASGDTTITNELVENLYKKTIMNRVVDKMADDASRLGFRSICTDIDGQTHDKAQEIGRSLDKLMTRRTLRQMYRDMLIYGDAYLYKQVGKSPDGLTNVLKVYGMSPKRISAKIENNELKGWQFQGPSGTVDLKVEEVIHIPRNPLTGNLYGISIFESTLQILNLILNSQLNSAVLIDHYALPLIHWQIDAKHERRKTPLSEIKNFIGRLGKMTTGSDLVTDASIGHEIVGATTSIPDISTILDKLDSYFFATTGVPGQILGMEADNLSAITRQLQTYYETIAGLQNNAADYVSEQLYWPEIENAGIEDLYDLSYTYRKPMVEQESRIQTWVQNAVAMDLIDMNEGREALGYQGPPPSESNGMQWILGNPNAGQEPEFDKKQTQETPPGVKQKGAPAAKEKSAQKPQGEKNK
jgi:hypothetical protein